VPSTAAALGDPVAVAADGHGNVLIADTDNNVIRAVAGSNGVYYGQSMVAGDIYTIVGDGNAGFSGVTSPLTAAELNAPTAVAVDPQGDLAISDTGNGAVRLVAGVSGSRYGKIMTAGHIYTIAAGGTPGVVTDGGDANAAGFSSTDGIAFDPWGNVIVADTVNDNVSLLPQNSGTYYGRAVTPGFIYTLAGNGAVGFSGNRGPAPMAELSLQTLAGVATDATGNLFLADGGNNVIWMIAASSGSFHGILVKTGYIYTVAGNGTAGFTGNKKPATAAELDGPQGVAVDQSGNLLIGDSNNNVIRLVPVAKGKYDGQRVKAGDIYTFAGNGLAGYRGDGGSAKRAELNAPAGVALGPSSHLLIADNGNDVIRAVIPRVPPGRHRLGLR